MKRLFQWSVVPALLLFIGMHASAAEYRIQPSIFVFVNNDQALSDRGILRTVDGDDSEFGCVAGDTYVCACGAASNAKGRNGASYTLPTAYSYTASYRVISFRPGHFMVHVQYDIDRNGASTKVDRMLPVWEKKPAKANWARLDGHFTACAYLSTSATR